MPKRTLAQVQLAVDTRRLGGRPSLLERKWRRMARSPFAFLRGASPLFIEALRRGPALLRGLPGRGWLVGDLHLENAGLFRSSGGVTFHVNDFDETFEGPWSVDVARVLTSLLLARPELGVSGLEVVQLSEALLDGYGEGLRGGRGEAPAFIEALVAEAEALPVSAALKKKLDTAGRLVRSDEKTPDAPASVTRLVPAMLEAWRAGLPEAVRPADAAMAVLDVTRRLAGTGSLGVERLLVLTRGDADGPWLLEVKEVRGSPASTARPSAERLVSVVRRVLPHPPALLGPARLGRLPVVVTRLSPKEDKLGVDEVPDDARDAWVRHLGVLTGEVHRRGGEGGRWTSAHRRQALEASRHLAGLHETAFLEFCAEVGRRLDLHPPSPLARRSTERPQPE